MHVATPLAASSIDLEPALATFTRDLACTPTLARLRWQLAMAEAGLDFVAGALADDVPLVRLLVTGHCAYLAAVALAVTIDRLLLADDHGLRTQLLGARRTATRMLDTLDRIARPRDRALRAALLREAAPAAVAFA